MQVNCVGFVACRGNVALLIELRLHLRDYPWKVQFVIFAILSHTEIYCSVAKWREGVGGGRGVTWLEQPCTQSICAAKQTIDVTKGLHNWDRVETIYIWMHQFQLVQLNAWFACFWAANRFASLKHAELGRGVIIKLTYVHTVSSSSSTSIICRSHSAAGVVEIINVYHVPTNHINIVENESNAPNKIIGCSL